MCACGSCSSTVAYFSILRLTMHPHWAYLGNFHGSCARIPMHPSGNESQYSPHFCERLICHIRTPIAFPTHHMHMLTSYEDINITTVDKSDNMLRRRAQPRHCAQRRVPSRGAVGHGAVSRRLQLAGDPSSSMHPQQSVAGERFVGFSAAVLGTSFSTAKRRC